MIDSKKPSTSRTVITNATIIAFMPVLEYFNIQIPQAVILAALPAINIALRFITSKPISLFKKRNSVYDKIEFISEFCHELNRKVCEKQKDFSQQEWESAPDWQKASIRNGVIDNITGSTSGPEESHRRWMLLKIREGWKYGPKKDVEKKEHPCMVEYGNLPGNQKIKDFLFFNSCKVLNSIFEKGENQK